jgi:hypothetical protein
MGRTTVRLPSRWNTPRKAVVAKRYAIADLFLGRGIEERRSVVAVRRDESTVDVDRVDGAHGISPFHHFGESLDHEG